FRAEDGIRDGHVTGVQTCALPISSNSASDTGTSMANSTARRIGVVVVTHGQLATELLNAAEMIVGELPQFLAVSIGWHDDVEVRSEERRVGKEGGSG